MIHGINQFDTFFEIEMGSKTHSDHVKKGGANKVLYDIDFGQLQDMNTSVIKN